MRRSGRSESRIQSDTIEALRADGWFVFKISAGPNQEPGMPDLIGWKNGLPVAMEMKREIGGEVSKIQAHKMSSLAKHGVISGCPNSVEDAVRIANMVAGGTANRYAIDHVCLSCGETFEKEFRCECGGYVVLLPRERD